MKLRNGFSLLELMIVVAIIAFLAVVAVPTYTRFLSKAKRAEVYMNLSAIYTAQKVYWAEHGKYSDVLFGEGGIGWKPEGQYYYTYGFAHGTQGKNFFIGKLNTPNSYLAPAKADANSFIVAAAGDLHGNGKPDIITIDQNNNIQIIQDGLN
ncbi:MAG TPA: prepilin-type N-terminal cleavage/methylation domain-containing protein [Candidatus Dependentiae bacterium]|nr:prepilin-type N-terminal cleavage/methylation domain-containing protein [Candidatus Dependentiae bacterium]HRQ62718.1 prepilin-type N-terminal cleavage/methylation domain-containing protein [Candidatus Dependentiae bacterium]